MENKPLVRRKGLGGLLVLLVMLGGAMLFLGGCSDCGFVDDTVSVYNGMMNTIGSGIYAEMNFEQPSEEHSRFSFGDARDWLASYRRSELKAGESQEFLAVKGAKWGDTLKARVLAAEPLTDADDEETVLDEIEFTLEKPDGLAEGAGYEVWVTFVWDGEKLTAQYGKVSDIDAASGTSKILASEAVTPFNPIAGVDFDADGNSYVVVARPGEVLKYSPEGKLLKKWGKDGTGDGEFNRPMGIAVDRKNKRVYVGDTGNSRIQKFDTEGEFLGKWGTPGSGDMQFDKPLDVVWSPADDSVFVSDYDPANWGGNCVVRQFLFDDDGGVKDEIVYDMVTLAEKGWFAPGGVAVDADGKHFYVTELQPNGKVYKVSTGEDAAVVAVLEQTGVDGKYPAKVFPLPAPEAAGVKDAGTERFYVSYISDPNREGWKNDIVRFVASGDVVSRDEGFVSPTRDGDGWVDGWKGAPKDALSRVPDGKILMPGALAATPDGKLVVGDSSNSRISVLAESGDVLRSFVVEPGDPGPGPGPEPGPGGESSGCNAGIGWMAGLLLLSPLALLRNR